MKPLGEELLLKSQGTLLQFLLDLNVQNQFPKQTKSKKDSHVLFHFF